MNKDIYLSDESYLAALERQKNRIKNLIPLVSVDDDTIGAKETHVSWGLCSKEKEAWPNAQDHLWPEHFKKFKRVAPKYLQSHQRCPLDMREEISRSSGCYYYCRFFQKKKFGSLTQEETLKLYKKTIKAFKLNKLE